MKSSRAVPTRVTARGSKPRRPLEGLIIVTLGAAIVLAACGGGKRSAPPSFDSIRDALRRAGTTICDEVVEQPGPIVGPFVGATNARSYYLDPCPNGGIVEAGAFPNENVRDQALEYLLGLDKASFTPGQSGPVWKHGWRVRTFAVVIAADTPPAATMQVDGAMNALDAERVQLGVVPSVG